VTSPLFVLLASLAAVARVADPQISRDLETARLLQSQYRWAAAESLATAVLGRLTADPRPDSLALAEALYLMSFSKHSRGVYADTAGQRAAFRCLAIRDRALPPDDGRVAEALLLRSRWLSSLGHADSAVAPARRAIAIRTLRHVPGDSLLAGAWGQLGRAHRDRQDFESALVAYDSAMAGHLQAHGECVAVVFLLAEAGYSLQRLGELERAREKLERALAISNRSPGPDSYIQSQVLDYLAGVELEAGNVARGIDLAYEAVRVISLHRRPDDLGLLRLQSNLGNSLMSFGDYAAARRLFESTAPAFRSAYGADHWRTMSTRVKLGMALASLGDTAAAGREFVEIESLLASKPGPPDPSLGSARHYQGELLYLEGRPAAARAALESALRTERALRAPRPLEITRSHYALIATLEALGDTAALAATRRELLHFADSTRLAPGITAHVVTYWNARALRGLGREAEAWSTALEADRQARRLVALNARLLPDRSAIGLSSINDRELDLVLDLSRGRPERFEIAWDRVVRSRGMVRAELARRRLPPALRGDSTVARAHARRVDAQQTYARALVALPRGPGNANEEAELERLRLEADHAERDYARQIGQHGGVPPATDPGWADVRARLAPGQALVAFVTTEVGSDTARVSAFVARSGSANIERVELGRAATLRAALDPWLEGVAASPGPAVAAGSPAERRCRELGKAVRALTWDRLAPALAGAQELYVVPDGALLDLPWHALPDGGTAYLVERDPRIHVLYAERELLEPRAAPRSPTLLAVGAPDYAHAPSTSPESGPVLAVALRSSGDPCAARQGYVFDPLPGAAAEVEAVARGWRAAGGAASLLTGMAATEEAFKREAQQREVIHLATHGLVADDTCAAAAAGQRGVGGVAALATNHPAGTPPPARVNAQAPSAPAAPRLADSPWIGRRVWLALAGANRAADPARDENEGLLTAEEIVTLDLTGTDWVVLSACHSGVAPLGFREGALGMRRAFHLAGARSVIASQWAVADEATREWMQALYEARTGGVRGGSEAIAAASRGVLAERRRGRRSTHPFYWAAFSASGE